MKPLRIFISSPGDVISERRRAGIVIDKLRREYARFFAIEPYLWESEPMLASGHFQDIIEPPSSFDILVLIVWSRLGTPLPPSRTGKRAYEGIGGRVPVTGTEWEFEEALTAHQSCGAPDLLAYKNTQPVTTLLNDREQRREQEAQWDALQEFWARHFEDRGTFRASYTSFETFAFEARFEMDLRTLIERRIKAMQPAEGGGKPLSWFGNPFRGLNTYEFEHAPVFFGREGPIKRAVERLAANEEQGSAFLLILGASGSGKSSLVRAGVLPRLFAPGVVSGVGQWRRAIFRPGDGEHGLFEGLARALIATGALPELIGPGMTADDLGRHLRAAAAHPDLPFRTGLERIAAEAHADKTLLGHETVRLVLVIDQLEELFTTPGIPADYRDGFVSLLTGLARSRLVWVVATMRSDFWHRAAETPALVELAEGRRRIDLLAPDQAEVAEMIRRPALAAGLTFETDTDTGLGLDAVLTEAAAGGGGVLPLLSFVLDALYQRDVEHGDHSVLTFASYDAVGRLHGAIGNRAEDLYRSLTQSDPEAAAALPRLLRKLVTISTAGDEPTTRAASLDDFAPGNPDLRLVEALLHPSARLLVSEGDGTSARIRLAHEALIRNWPRAVEQLQRDRRDIEIRARLETQELLWREAQPRDKSKRLLTGLALAEGLDLTQRWKDELSPQLHEFVAASSRQEKGRLRRFQIATAAFACLSIIAIVAAFWALQAQQRAGAEATRAELAQNEAIRQADIALTRLLAAQAELARDYKGNLLPRSVLLAVEAVRRSPSFESLQALRESVALVPRPTQFVVKTGNATVAFSPDFRYLASANGFDAAQVWEMGSGREVARMGHTGGADNVTFSPDGSYLATFSSIENTVHVWELPSGREIAHIAHGKGVVAVAFSPDHKFLATAGDDLTARVWEVATGLEVARMTHEEDVTDVAFSPDGKRIATASWDDIIRVWEIANGLEAARTTYDSDVNDLAFSPNGKALAVASGVASGGAGVGIWEIADDRDIAVITQEPVYKVAFSPNGKYLATASFDGTARVWEIASGREVTRIAHEGEVYEVAFGRGGQLLATASLNFLTEFADNSNGIARIWEAFGERELARMTHEESVEAAAFSPDAKYLATTSTDDSASVWEIASGRELARLVHKGNVYDVAFSPTGEYLATASWDRTARVWEISGGREVARMRHEKGVTEVEFSPDGKSVVSASEVGALVWESITGREIGRVSYKYGAGEIASSPDGKHLATCNPYTDNSARVWEITTGREVARMSHKEPVQDIDFSPDGKFLATASMDHTARVWEIASRREIVRMAHEESIETVDFSRDGKYLATGSHDGTARVWEISGGREVARMAHEEVVHKVVFSNDGKYLATNDDTARVWESVSGREIARMTVEEYVEEIAFSPDGKYLVTGDNKGFVQLWLLRPKDLIRDACTRLTRNLTREEWRLYLPNKPYRKTCPNLPGAGK